MYTLDRQMPRARARVLAFFFTVLLTVSALPARASFELEPVTPQQRGIGTRLTFALANACLDPGGLSGSDSTLDGAVSIYGFRPFGMDGIEFGAISTRMVVSAARRPVLFSYQRLKASEYVEETCVASVGMVVRRVFLQPVARFGRISLDGNSCDWAVLLDFYLACRVPGHTTVCVGLQNPFGLGLRKEDSACPQRLQIGLQVAVLEQLIWSAEATQQGGFPTSVATGMEWSAFKGLVLRAGMRTDPREFCFGLGVMVGGITIDVGTSFNFNLGATREAGVTIGWD